MYGIKKICLIRIHHFLPRGPNRILLYLSHKFLSEKKRHMYIKVLRNVIMDYINSRDKRAER